MSIARLLDRPIAYHRCLVTLTGSVTGAVMLSQAIYWQNRCNGDFYKTQAEWEEETGLTPDAFYRYAMQTNYGTGGVAPVGPGGRGSRNRWRHRARTISRQ